MAFQRTHKIVLMVLIALSACTYDVGVEPFDKYNIDIGSFELLDESILVCPYLHKTGVIFVDSSGNELAFSIHESQIILTDGTILHYDVYVPGDTVRYQYKSELKSFILENDSLDLSFNLGIRAQPYSANPTNGFVADVLTLLFRISTTPEILALVFNDIVDTRTWPIGFSYTTNLGSMTIFNKTFEDVLISELFTSPPRVLFNYEVGIVAFPDHSEKMWRFDRFQ